MTAFAVHQNGTPATVDHLAPVVFAGGAHFTAMQIRSGAVRGLDLHLDRLRHASTEMFGTHLPDDQIRGYLRQAIEAARADASLSCFVAPRPERGGSTAAAALDVFIRTGPPADPPEGPLALDVVDYQRHLAPLKHVGEVAKSYYLRHAVSRGFDDAAFVDSRGRLSEATIWNLAFWDGTSVVWPEADLLRGITMQVLSRQLKARGVPQRTQDIRADSLEPFSAAVVMNSWTPAIVVDRIGDHSFADGGSDFAALLHQTYDAESPALP
ncbi:aminotransferase class IV [Luteipulveratus mongoliensis]|uniref:Branched-chain amino acid aminotransferase n=1 Tax=Luteipulveratus mongoliensis TaxID=571913 RepID=A0A0K1JJM1_9MICO|nr:aminotransferase class IV [Luteipulveratus mongoliensis]AKU16906.1 branched-chain amino acid aminotransferase [Luteipulveratus mongoliensis]